MDSRFLMFRKCECVCVWLLGEVLFNILITYLISLPFLLSISPESNIYNHAFRNIPAPPWKLKEEKVIFFVTCERDSEFSAYSEPEGLTLSPGLLWVNGSCLSGSSSGSMLICPTDPLFPPEEPPRPSPAYSSPFPATHTSWFTKSCYLLIVTTTSNLHGHYKGWTTPYLYNTDTSYCT